MTTTDMIKTGPTKKGMITRVRDRAARMLRAYLLTIGFGFRSAPLHATGQLITGVIMALAGPVLAYGGKLIIDAVVATDLWLGLITGLVMAVAIGADPGQRLRLRRLRLRGAGTVPGARRPAADGTGRWHRRDRAL